MNKTNNHMTTTMKPSILITGAVAFGALVSCKNPADDTADAEVRDAQPVASADGGETYVFTNASTIGFTGSKVTGSHDGGFKSFTGSFDLSDGEPVAGKVVIDMNSTWSDNDDLTTHLKNHEFFDVPKFPETTFEATGFEKQSDASYEISGNLTLHGVTKNITFPAQVESSDGKATIKAEFDINRRDFAINFPGKADDLINDEVIIRFDLTATRD